MARKTIGYIGTMGSGCPSPEGDCTTPTCRQILSCVDFRECMGIPLGEAGAACLPATLDPPDGILGACTASTTRAFEVSGGGADANEIYCIDNCAGVGGSFLFSTPGTDLWVCECGIFGRQGFFTGVCQDGLCQGEVHFSISPDECGAIIEVQISVGCPSFVNGNDSALYRLTGSAASDAITGFCADTPVPASLPKISESFCGGTAGNPTTDHCCGPFADTITLAVI